MTAKQKKTTKDGLPFGRPTKYKPEFCAKAVELLAQGHSLYAVAAEFDVCIDTIFDWQRNNDDFSYALKIGKAKSAVWWEKRAQEFAETGVGNATAIIFGLKNRAKKQWADKTEQEINLINSVPDFGDL